MLRNWQPTKAPNCCCCCCNCTTSTTTRQCQCPAHHLHHHLPAQIRCCCSASSNCSDHQNCSSSSPSSIPPPHPPPFSSSAFLVAIAPFLSFLLFSANVLLQLPSADLMPNNQYRVHFFKRPEGEWLSLLNLHVVFQTPDVVDVEEKAHKHPMREPPDFDYDDEEEGNGEWMVIQLDPIEWHQRNWTTRISEKDKSKGKSTDRPKEVNGTGREIVDGTDSFATTTPTTTTKWPKEVPSTTMGKEEKEGQQEEELQVIAGKKEVPELSLLRNILPWIPHMLRKHHRVHKPKKKGKARMHLEQILAAGTTTMALEEETMTTNEMETTTTIAPEDNATDSSNDTTIINVLSLEKENVTLAAENVTAEPPPPPLEPINEEELALNLHKDSLHRNASTLRQLLTSNLSIVETLTGDARSREMYRDLGGSFILPLLKEIHYDNKSIPLVFSDQPLRVFISLEILHLGNFDNFQMEYELDMLFHVQWYDVRLANNFTKPVRIKEQAIIDKIWKPDAMFFNSKYSFFHVVSFPNFRMRIRPDGHITYTSRITLLPDCQMNFCNFPHDTQRCGLLISSIAHPKAMLELLWDEQRPIVFAKKISLPDLRIKSIGTEECRIGGKLIPSACLTLSFLLQRDSARYVAEKYLPSTLAMIFSWVAPYVPYNYEEVRIITPITVLLTLVQMEKGNQEVITSYLTSLDIWFVVIKAFTVLSLVESLTVMAYIKRARAVEKQAQRASTEYHKELLQAEARRIVNVYHQLDHLSRVFSPVAFICFLMYYMAFIVQRDEQECKEQRMISAEGMDALLIH